MLARSAQLALALMVAAPVTAFAQGFEYAPSTSQFRITTATKTTQDMMGQSQSFDGSSNQLVTVTVARPVKDTLAMTVVLDSINVVLPMGMTPPGLDKLPGTKVTSRLSPSGVVYSAQGPDSTVPNAEQLTQEMSRVLPRVRAALAPGATWSDTVTIKAKQNSIDLVRNVIAKYTVVGDTTVGTMKSWKIARETSTKMSGSGAPNGQSMTLDGTATGKATVCITKDNVFVGLQNEEQTDIKIVLTANGMEIGQSQTATTKVEKVK